MTETETLLLDALEKLSARTLAQYKTLTQQLKALEARLDELYSAENGESDDSDLPSLRQLDEWTTNLDSSLSALTARVAEIERKI